MAYIRLIAALGVLGIVVVRSLSRPGFAEPALSLGQKATLQAAMQRHIERQSVDGVYLQLNGDTGDVRRLHPGAAHPLIVRMGEVFVLCTDFRDDGGDHVNVDFYLVPKDNFFVVFQTVVDNRGQLERLMNIGKAEIAG